MPELPEVETVRRTLEPYLLGRRIMAFEALWERAFTGSPEAKTFLQKHLGQLSITATDRRAKLLLLKLGLAEEASLLLAFHLRMTGQLLLKTSDSAPDRHTRLMLTLDDGLLFFDDMRKFGYCHVLLPHELDSWKFWQTLGPEPLEISSTEFAACFLRDKDKKLMPGKVKNLLMDQKIIAGVGNIYADESLFRAGIRPDKPACEVGTKELKKLHKHLVEVLNHGIMSGGSSIRDYRDGLGNKGLFQENFNVYGRKGLPCTKCERELSHMKLAGRSTVFCEYCQK